MKKKLLYCYYQDSYRYKDNNNIIEKNTGPTHYKNTMSQAVAIDISSLIRRYNLPEHYYPSYLRHPNQPFSSPSSVSSSSSSISSFDQECDANDAVNDSLSAISVDGEVDTRIEIIQHQQQQPIIVGIEKKQVLDPSCMRACASAPPLSDDEIENENIRDKQREQQQQQEKQEQQQKEEVCVCVICYETFEQPAAELIRGRHYSMEELEEIEGKEKITDFCQTCKYNVHHKCIDEYRLSKMTDIIRSGYQRGRIQSPNIAGIFGMKCLMCAKEVEKIHVSSDGDINIVKTQADANDQNRGQQEQEEQEQQQQQQQQRIEEVMQNRIQEAMQNRMQRRLRRRHRLEFCRKKLCSICLMFLVTVLLLVFVFRAI